MAQETDRRHKRERQSSSISFGAIQQEEELVEPHSMSRDTAQDTLAVECPGFRKDSAVGGGCLIGNEHAQSQCLHTGRDAG